MEQRVLCNIEGFQKEKKLVVFDCGTGMLWNSGCSRTADAVEQQMLWNSGCCRTLMVKKRRLIVIVASACCETTNAVEQRMLWNSGCCGTADAVEHRGG